MTVLTIDRQGGTLRGTLAEAVKKTSPDIDSMAGGTNPTAFSNVRSGGGEGAAAGETAVEVACHRVDNAIGPIGIADAGMGDRSPEMANAVGGGRTDRMPIPANHSSAYVAAVAQSSAAIFDDVVGHGRQLNDEMGKCA